MQIFSRNPRGWAVSKLANEDVAEFRRVKREYDITPVVVHIPYLINLATPDDKLYKRSIEAYILDLDRADRLGAEYFVTHLGSHVGSGEEAGIERFSSALNNIIGRARPDTTILLENTAGSGASIGYRFEHIKSIMDRLKGRAKVGICFDTAHAFEAGYDLGSKDGFERTFDELNRLIGTDSVKVVHFNDSLSAGSSRVDRHQHIGKGRIGLQGLKRVINCPGLQRAAFIMETPKESDRDELMNMASAKRMVKR